VRRPAPLLAALLLGCGPATTAAPVIQIGAPTAPPAAAASAAPDADLPFLGAFARYAVVAWSKGQPTTIGNAHGPATLRVEAHRVVYEQRFPEEGKNQHVTQVYAFEPKDVRRAGEGFEIVLVHRSISGDLRNYAPDKRHPRLEARRRAWGWDLTLLTFDTIDVIAGASFGRAPPDQPPFDLSAYIRLVTQQAPEEATAAPSAPPDVDAPPSTATFTASGLAYRFLRRGSGGRSPSATDTVVVHYTGWTTDGRMFDSSSTRGSPATFPLSAVIKGWTEGLQLMRAGDRARFWIPPTLAYGVSPQNGAPAGMLVFDVDLIVVM
jgi:hypothetical protein